MENDRRRAVIGLHAEGLTIPREYDLPCRVAAASDRLKRILNSKPENTRNRPGLKEISL